MSRETQTSAATADGTDPAGQFTAPELVAAELPDRDANKDLYGLALSGGGIRSATFNLGLLQGLHRFGLLKHFDYLSTVSGGGYIGGWWTRWRAFQQEAATRNGRVPSAALFPGPDSTDVETPRAVAAEVRPIRHLREYSNFLTPRVGLFSWDTGRMVVAACSAMIPALVVAAAVLVLGIGGLLLLMRGFAGDIPTLLILLAVVLASGLLVLRSRVNHTSGNPRQRLLMGGGRLAAGVDAVVLLVGMVALFFWFTFGDLLALRFGPPVVELPALGEIAPVVFAVVVTLVTLVVFELAWLRRREESRNGWYLLACVVALVFTSIAFARVGTFPGFDPDRRTQTEAAAETHPIRVGWLPAVTPEAQAQADSLAGAPLPQPAPARGSTAAPSPAEHREQRFVAAATAYAGGLTYLYSPALAWLLVVLAFVAFRTLGSRWMNSRERRSIRSAFDRAQSRLTFLTVAWTAGVTLWIAGAVLAYLAGVQPGTDLQLAFGGTTGVLTLLFGIVHRQLSKSPLKANGAGFKERLKPMLPQLIAYAVLTLSVVGLMALVASLPRLRWDLSLVDEVLRGLPLLGGSLADTLHAAGNHLAGKLAVNGASLVKTMLVFGGSLFVVGFALLFFNPNEVGLHGFYRGRLVRGFTGACDPDEDVRGRTEECPNDDLPLDDAKLALPPDGPRVHLICCAANDLDSATALENLNRGATSGVLSTVGVSVGDRFSSWQEYRDGGGTVPTLGAAMTASGAAFNSLMGWRSVAYGPAATFLLAALNLRLGLWLRHPCPPQAKRWGSWVNWLSGFPYFKEMFSSVSATDSLVHLSDGGHFENLAVYELIRRRCRVIVASDCGQDGAHEFEDLGRLCRQVRVDFGVDIRIDVSPLKPGTDGRAKQHMVAGDIHYPDGNTGVLLYFKPVLVGCESADVAHYRMQNKEFPHESTLDQFYDEAQWEAYRRLGEHAVTTAFRAVADDGEIRERQDAAELLGRARREWMTVRDGLADGLARFRSGSLELDDLLRKPENSKLKVQVYPELAVGTIPAMGTFPPKQNRLSAAEVAESELHTLRRMLLLLHELFLSEDLEANHTHAAYLGLINYFRRWTTTERLGFWWPVLRPHFPPPVVRFVETRLGAKQLSSPEIRLDPPPGGVDLLRGGESVGGPVVPPPEGWDAAKLSYWIGLGQEDDRATPKVCLARITGLRKADTLVWRVALAKHAELAGPGLLDKMPTAWRNSGLVVADAYWGVGVGQNFLTKIRALGEPAGEEPAIDAIRHCVVKLERPSDATAFQKQTLATEMQLYRSSGFQPAHVTGAGDVFLDDTRMTRTPGQRVTLVPAEIAQETADTFATWMYLGSPEPGSRGRSARNLQKEGALA